MITQNTFLHGRRVGDKFTGKTDFLGRTIRKQDESIPNQPPLFSLHVDGLVEKPPVCAIMRPELPLQVFNLVTV